MNKSRIQWTDYTWSPVTGCSKISAGCKNCYAEAWHKRFKDGDFSVKLHPEKLSEPLSGLLRFHKKHWHRPRVFVCPMADLFHDDVPTAFIQDAWKIMMMASHIDFIVLTKRPERMRDILCNDAFRIATCTMSGDYPLPNVWLGVTAENQEAANQRIPILLQTPAAVRWVSVEPMLGPVDLTSIKWARINADPSNYEQFGVPAPKEVWSMNDALTSRPADEWNPAKVGLDWVVCGGESGAGARPMETEWVRDLRDQCHDARVPFFFKQWGPEGGLLRDGLPALDSVVHNAFPEAQREER